MLKEFKTETDEKKLQIQNLENKHFLETQSLQNKIIELESQVEKQKDEIASLNDRIESYRNDIQMLEKLNAIDEKEMKEEAESIQKMKKERDYYKEAYEKKQGRVIKLEEVNLEQKVKLTNLQEDYNREKKYAEGLTREIEQLRQKSSELEDEGKRMKLQANLPLSKMDWIGLENGSEIDQSNFVSRRGTFLQSNYPSRKNSVVNNMNNISNRASVANRNTVMQSNSYSLIS